MIVDQLPRWLTLALPQLSLILVGIAVEKYYVSRVTCFTNTMALTLHVLSLENAPELMIWFTDIGFLIGVIGFASYVLNRKTPLLYNVPAYFLYSSTTVGLLILSGDSFLLAVVLGSMIQLGAGIVLGDAELVYSGPRPGPVHDFIKGGVGSFVDAYGVQHEVELEVMFEP